MTPQRMMDFLSYCDGNISLEEITSKINCSRNISKKIYLLLKKKEFYINKFMKKFQ